MTDADSSHEKSSAAEYVAVVTYDVAVDDLEAQTKRAGETTPFRTGRRILAAAALLVAGVVLLACHGCHNGHDHSMSGGEETLVYYLPGNQNDDLSEDLWPVYTEQIESEESEDLDWPVYTNQDHLAVESTETPAAPMFDDLWWSVIESDDRTPEEALTDRSGDTDDTTVFQAWEVGSFHSRSPILFVAVESTESYGKAAKPEPTETYDTAAKPMFQAWEVGSFHSSSPSLFQKIRSWIFDEDKNSDESVDGESWIGQFKEWVMDSSDDSSDDSPDDPEYPDVDSSDESSDDDGPSTTMERSVTYPNHIIHHTTSTTAQSSLTAFDVKLHVFLDEPEAVDATEHAGVEGTEVTTTMEP
jgi:hypothetical protein